MKNKCLWLLIGMLCLNSCSQMYYYVQVFETQPLTENIKSANKGLLYEDEHCSIYYSFWANGGDASFSIYNKTNDIMYLDLSKSFFIRNNIANDYYKERVWETSRTESTSVNSSIALSGSVNKGEIHGVAYQGNYSTLPVSGAEQISPISSANVLESHGVIYSTAVANSFATSKSVSTAYKEQKIIAIPPKATKIVIEYSISDNFLLDCDLDRYPEEKASIEFNETTTPLRFTNYVTYKLGESSQEQVIKNTFYVSRITNYAEPFLFTYIERTKPCQNLTSENKQVYSPKYPEKVYDRYYVFDTSKCFFLKYNIWSKYKHYEDKGGFYYSYSYDGFVKTGMENKSAGSK